MRQSVFVFAIILAVGWPFVAFGQTETEKLLAESDPAIQAQITALFNSQSEVEVFQQLEKLTKMTDDKALLAKQLAIFAVAAPNQKEMHGLQTAGIMHRLETQLALQGTTLIRALAPYLDSESEDLRDFVQMWFHNHDSNDRIHGKPPLGSVNYHEYMEYVRARLGRNEEIPNGFIEYIYERNPGKALLVYAKAMGVENTVAQLQGMREAFDDRQQGKVPTQEEMQERREKQVQVKARQESTNTERREIFFAEHIVSSSIWLKENVFIDKFQQALPEAKKQLKKLAEHDQWWARLYVAHIMHRHPELGEREVVKRLTHDSNEIVVKAAKKAARAIKQLDEAKKAKWLEKHGTDTEKLLAREQQSIQEQIHRVYDALKNQPWLDSTSNIKAFQETQKLKDIVANKFEIVSQIAIFAAQSDEEQQFHARTILDLLDLPPQIVVRVLARYLNAENTNLRLFVRDWFQTHDNAGSDASSLEEVNYKDYLNYVRGQLSLNDEIPTAFVEYIYERQPSRALLVFAYAASQPDVSSEIELSGCIINNAIWLKKNDFGERFQKALPEAKEQLTNLSEHDQWWARLYVAEIMRRHRELRIAGVLDKLSNDENALVSKAAKR